MIIHLYLDKPNNDNTFIVMSISFNGKRIRISTKQSVVTKNWNKKREKLNSGATNSRQINSYLDILKSSIEQKYHNIIATGRIPEKEEIIAIVKEITDSKEESERAQIISFFSRMEQFIREREESPNFKPYTTKHYRTTMKHLREFQKYRRKEIEYSEINKQFYEKLSDFLSVDRKLTINSAGGVIKDLRTFMYFSLNNGWTDNADFIQAFKVSKKESQAVALNEADLEKLENVELKDEHLKNVRDLFLIQLYTGLRYSDLVNLKPENIDIEGGYITIHQIKTQDRLRIPIHSRLKKHLLKYPGQKLRTISNQKYNSYIKKVCELAEINDVVQIVWFYGKQRKEETKFKHELVCSHTARRSFITLSLQKGGIPEDIMKVSGHRDRKSFQKYVKIAQNEAIERMKNLWEES